MAITSSRGVAIAKGEFPAESYCILAMPFTGQTLFIFLPGFSWNVRLTYLFAVIILAIGLLTLKRDSSSGQGLKRIIALGPVFIAVPIAVFGMDHFAAPKIVAGMVPGWIPGHLFWALFVGACLLAAALGIAAGRHVRLAAALLGLMIGLFVLLIHIPAILAAPHTRILWVVALRDSAFAGGAFALSALQKPAWNPVARTTLVTFARLSLAVAITVFGVQQFLHPELLSGVPLELSTPVWIPARLFFSYLTGVVFVVAGFSMVINKKLRLAATAAGIMTLFLVVVLYVPLVVSKPLDIENGLNYMVDTMFLCGSLLVFAESQRGSLSPEPEPASVRSGVAAG